MSKRLEIVIETGNAAFEGWLESFEVARILETLADTVKSSNLSNHDGLALRDINGNKVGQVRVMEATDDV